MTLTERKKEFVIELAELVAEEIICNATTDIEEEYMVSALALFKFDVMEGIKEEFIEGWSWKNVIGDRLNYTLSVPSISICYDDGFEVEEEEQKKELWYEELADTWFSPVEKKALFLYDEKKRWCA